MACRAALALLLIRRERIPFTTGRLLVLGLGPRRRRLTFAAGVAELVAGTSRKSVLLVPSRELGAE